MNAVQIIQNLCVKLCQLLVQTDDPVSLALAAFFLVRTAAAILALKIFLGSAVFIAPYRPAVNEMEFLTVRADWQTTFIDREIYRSVWIVAIFLVLVFFFINITALPRVTAFTVIYFNSLTRIPLPHIV